MIHLNPHELQMPKACAFCRRLTNHHAESIPICNRCAQRAHPTDLPSYEDYIRREVIADVASPEDTLNLREIEMRTIQAALIQGDGSIKNTAALLGVSRHAMRRLIQKYNLDGNTVLQYRHQLLLDLLRQTPQKRMITQELVDQGCELLGKKESTVRGILSQLASSFGLIRVHHGVTYLEEPCARADS